MHGTLAVPWALLLALAALTALVLTRARGPAAAAPLRSIEAELARKTEALRTIEAGLGAVAYVRHAHEGSWDYDFLTAQDSPVAGCRTLELLDRTAPSHAGEFETVGPNGETRWMRVVRGASDEGTEAGVLVDITEEMRRRQGIADHYRFDRLTGVRSRRYFEEAVAEAFTRYRCDGSTFALFEFDIDSFHEINETYGFDAGDALLRRVAETATRTLRKEDVVGRLGPDAFGILADIGSPANVERLVEKLMSGLVRYFEIAGERLFVSINLGAALPAESDDTSNAVMRRADIALERAKAAGCGNSRIYSDALRTDTVARAALKDKLRDAIAERQFFLEYQPKLSLRTGRVVGCEALIRWNHPALGVQPPNRFIPFAESSGLIVPIGEWVIQEACRQYAQWRDRGIPVVPVSVNVSAVQFARSDLPAIIGNALREAAIPAGALHLEITESVMVDYSHAFVNVLAEIRQAGVEIELDHFGTGHSALAYLKKLPLSAIKIDRSFVHGAIHDSTDATIVRGLVSLATQLGLRTIGEGAETVEQTGLLRDAGCHQVQGFFFSPPLPAAEFARFVAARRHETGVMIRPQAERAGPRVWRRPASRGPCTHPNQAPRHMRRCYHS